MSRRDGRDDDGVSIDGVTSIALSRTGKALLCRIPDASEDDGFVETWIPVSVITDDSEVYEPDQEGTLVLRTWWARKEGLDD